MALDFPITLAAPAKINLCLRILGRRKDGYHNLQTAFQLLDVADTLTFVAAEHLSVAGVPDVAASDNLIMRAARLLEPHAKRPAGAEITVNKVIPMGAGLGGGSSNAATTLVALNELWQCGLTVAELSELGRQLGADVPVFVQGQSAWGEGVGEALMPLKLPEQAYLLIYPNCHVPTAEIFTHPDLTRDSTAITIARFLSLGAGNDCESIVCRLYPEVGKALNWLRNFGPAKMTGTGSTVFIPCESVTDAEQIKAKVPASWQAIVASGVNQSKLISDLQSGS
jgi:4-diphosphocytidyl-2-C-methyl-D-erythritol kinase